MARSEPTDFREIPGYLPPWLRDNGYWWEFNNTSNFWCCKQGLFNMEEWFYYDMFYLSYLIYYYLENQDECPTEGCLNYSLYDSQHNRGFYFESSLATNSGTCFISGGPVANDSLTIYANQQTKIPNIYMENSWGITLNTNGENDKLITFWDAPQNPGDADYYLGFGWDLSAATDIQDTIISVDPMASNPTAFDRNIYLKPSQHGYVKFGKYQSCPTTVTITGYIEIVTEDGKVRKLAVIDDMDEKQTHYQGPS